MSTAPSTEETSNQGIPNEEISKDEIPKEMKAIVNGDSGGMQMVVDRPVAKPLVADPSVIVKVLFAGIHAMDGSKVDSLKDNTSGSSFNFPGKSLFHKNQIPGTEFSGVVVGKYGIGNKFVVGDQVFGTAPSLGTFCEYTAVPIRQVAKITENSPMLMADYAALPVAGLKALQCLKSNLPDTSRPAQVLLLGGGNGDTIMTTKVAKAMGNMTVTVVCSEANKPLMIDVGAANVVTSDGDIVEKLKQQTEQSGSPFHIVIDNRPKAEQEASKDLLQQISADTTILQGNVITMGKKAGFLEKTAQLKDRVSACCQSQPNQDVSQPNLFKSFEVSYSKSTEDLSQLNIWAADGKLQPRLADQIDFSSNEVQESLRKLLRGEVPGQIVMKVAEDDDAKEITDDAATECSDHSDDGGGKADPQQHNAEGEESKKELISATVDEHKSTEPGVDATGAAVATGATIAAVTGYQAPPPPFPDGQVAGTRPPAPHPYMYPPNSVQGTLPGITDAAAAANPPPPFPMHLQQQGMVPPPVFPDGTQMTPPPNFGYAATTGAPQMPTQSNYMQGVYTAVPYTGPPPNSSAPTTETPPDDLTARLNNLKKK